MKLKFILIPIAGLLFSCSSDDDNNSTSDNSFESDIIGTWELTSNVSDGESFFVCPDVEIYDGENRQFNELFGDDCENIAVGEANESYSIEGNILTVNVPDEDPDDDFDDSFTEVFEILTLNDTTLELSLIDDGDGEEEIDDISTYERQ